MYTPPRLVDRTIRVWADGRDVTDEDPSTWHWPYTEYWAQGWRPEAGPNSTARDWWRAVWGTPWRTYRQVLVHFAGPVSGTYKLVGG